MQNTVYSVIIPAYNEEKYLPDTLGHLIDVMSTVPDKGEIIVVDNNSTDKTDKVANRYGAIVVFEAHNQITRERNTGFAHSSGKYVFFLDADTHASAPLLKKALNMLKNEGYCGGGVLVSTGSKDITAANFIYSLVNRICRYLKVAPGCFIFCTREGFDAVGGFNERFYAAEEVWFSNSLRRWGKKNGSKFKVLESPKIKSSPRKLDSPSKVIYAFISLSLLPISAYFKSLCWYWYKKPR